jgi:predicted lactoylglutathione lyase
VATPQLNFFTLACADVERMADFLRALGWTEDSESEPVHRLFQGTNGVVVALYAASNYEPHFGPRADGFRGFTLGLNVGSPEEVDRMHELMRGIPGVEVLEEPFDSPHGFRGFSSRDPEGNIWDVAWKRGSTVTPDGDLTWS